MRFPIGSASAALRFVHRGAQAPLAGAVDVAVYAGTLRGVLRPADGPGERAELAGVATWTRLAGLSKFDLVASLAAAGADGANAAFAWALREPLRANAAWGFEGDPERGLRARQRSWLGTLACEMGPPEGAPPVARTRIAGDLATLRFRFEGKLSVVQAPRVGSRGDPATRGAASDDRAGTPPDSHP